MGCVGVAALAARALSLNVQSCEASVEFNRNAICLPVVISGSAQYEIELQRESAGSPDGAFGGFNDPRLNVGSSCIGCHIDGLNRLNNDLRDWVDEGSPNLPKGPYGVDGWIGNAATVKRVKELYPPSSVIRGYVEEGRQSFLGSMAQIKQSMVLGPNKNIYVEPVIWTVEYVQRVKYRYPQTTSN